MLAEGAIKDVLGQSGPTAVASGALGVQFIGNRHIVTGFVNVVGTSDTVRRAYGSTLLATASGGGLNAGYLLVRTRFRSWNNPGCGDYTFALTCNLGLRLEVDASTRRWATRLEKLAPEAGSTDSIVRITEVSDVPTWGGAAGLFYTFFDGAIETTDSLSRPVAMLLDVAIAHRAVRGDFTSTTIYPDSVRQRLLGTKHTDFTGAEIGLTLIFDRIKSSLTYYRFGGGADGLSRGQLVASVELRAPLASGLLRRQ